MLSLLLYRFLFPFRFLFRFRFLFLFLFPFLFRIPDSGFPLFQTPINGHPCLDITNTLFTSLGAHRIKGFFVMTNNHLYVLSVDNQQENMRTISKYVQQYQTSVTIGLVWYYGLLFQMLQRQPTAAITQRRLLSLISLLLTTWHSSWFETFKLHNTHFFPFLCFFFSLLLTRNKTYAPTTT